MDHIPRRRHDMPVPPSQPPPAQHENMASIFKLPAETLLHITEFLYELRDVASFSRVGNHHIYDVVTSVLYERVRDEVGVMCWACDEGSLGTVQRLLAAGADPNIAWESDFPRSYAMRNAMFYNLPANSRWDLNDDQLLWAGMPGVPPANSEWRQEWDARKAEYQEAEDLDSLKGHDSDAESNTGLATSDPEPVFNHLRVRYHSDRKIISRAQEYGWAPLHIAARWGHDEIVELLLDNGADIEAASCGYCDCIYPTDRARNFGATPLEALNRTGWLPLHTAICHEQESTVKLLLSRAAPLNVVHPSLKANVSPLHTACASGATSIARFLVDQLQMDVESKDHLGHTPISYAYFTGMWECIDFLIERGATLDTKMDDWPLIWHACKEARFAEALRLMELGANVYSPFKEGPHSTRSRYGPGSALRFCCLRQPQGLFPNVQAALRSKRQQHLRAEVVKQLMKPEHRTADYMFDWTRSLAEAARSHFADVVCVFLEAGVGNQDTWLGGFHFALESYMLSGPGKLPGTVEVILPYLEDKIVTSDFVLTSIMDVLASSQRDKDKRAVVQLLLGRRPAKHFTRDMAVQLWAHIFEDYSQKLRNIFLESGLEPPRQEDLPRLMAIAIEANSAAALEYLFTLNEAPEPLLDGSHLFYALASDALNCAEFLIVNGVSTNYRSPHGDTCLLEACRIPRIGAARMLLEKGADPNAYGPDTDDVPLVQAALGEHIDLVRTLLDHGASVHQTDGHAGGLTFALFMGSEDSARAMILSESFKNASQQKRNEYIEIALAAPLRAWCGGRNLEYLLRFGGVDPNYMANVGIPPLVGLFVSFRPHAVGLLKKAGAKIHKRLDRRPAARSNPEPTVLQLAISAADEDLVRSLLDDEDLCLEDQDGERDNELTADLATDYVRAACGRYNALIIATLRDHNLDFERRDQQTGDTAVHMICQSLDHHLLAEQADVYDNDDDMEEMMITHAAQAAVCINYMVSDLGIDPTLKNHLGVSGCELARQRINYQGDNAFLRKVAAAWGALIDVDDGSIKQAPGGRERFAQENNISLQVLRDMEADFGEPSEHGDWTDQDDEADEEGDQDVWF